MADAERFPDATATFFVAGRADFFRATVDAVFFFSRPWLVLLALSEVEGSEVEGLRAPRPCFLRLLTEAPGVLRVAADFFPPAADRVVFLAVERCVAFTVRVPRFWGELDFRLAISHPGR